MRFEQNLDLYHCFIDLSKAFDTVNREALGKFLYKKNQQNSMNCWEDMSQNVDFGPKRGKFGPKRAQNGRNQIFPGTFTMLFHK